MKVKLCLLATLLSAAACKTGTGSALMDDEVLGDATKPENAVDDNDLTAKANKAKFASGNFQGIDWEMRFNFPQCDHSAEGPFKKKGVFCTGLDAKAAAEFGGVEKELAEWANLPETKTIFVAYFSFSDKEVAKTLCDAANAGKKVRVFIHRENWTVGSVPTLRSCSPDNLKVYPRGTQLGFLQHAKIFLASPFDEPLPLSMMPEDQRGGAADLVTRWTSSSANMSAFGTSLHFDNWLFFQAKTSERLAQENMCFFNSIQSMKNYAPDDGGAEFGQADLDAVEKARANAVAEAKANKASDFAANSEGQKAAEAMKTDIVRWDFSQRYDACIKQIQAPIHPEIQFFPVPNEYQVNGQKRNAPQIWPKLKNLLNNAQTEIKVISDRLTSGQVYGPLVNAKQRGVDVQVILDDDTLRVSKCNGGLQLDQVEYDAISMHSMIDGGVGVTFLDTNGGNPPPPTLQHNKLMIIDRKTLLQGAGNFTASAININGPGNFEHFYLIQVPEIVNAYLGAWDYLLPLTTKPDQHEVSANPFKPINNGKFGPCP